ncbi:MAG: hypothetical protein HFH93_07035 [Lachnospiraceae bacterium]|nr:hypothetical protein [Lachnospiraceae bacterium]
MDKKILSLRMERQCLLKRADEAEYIALYRDTQPGQNEYWHGFGEPPVLSFRAGFDDIAFNRKRQSERRLVKGRFAGGNLGWIMAEDMELFASLYRKPLTKPTPEQSEILTLIENAGPFTIQQLKEETGLLVKQITPVLHRLQEAFLIYEDQYDGEWDRGWYAFAEMFPEADTARYTKAEALKILLPRFAYRMVWFDVAMAKAFYRVPEKEIRKALAELAQEDRLVSWESGYLLKDDAALLADYEPKDLRSVYALHRNDFLFKAREPALKQMVKDLTQGLTYDCEPLQYLLIDGRFRGASVGHFRYGPYDLNDIVCDLPDGESRREEIMEAVLAVNPGAEPKHFMGSEDIFP